MSQASESVASDAQVGRTRGGWGRWSCRCIILELLLRGERAERVRGGRTLRLAGARVCVRCAEVAGVGVWSVAKG